MAAPDSAVLGVTLAAIARTAARRCRASDARIMLVDGDRLRAAAHEGRHRPASAAGATVALSRDTVAGAAVLDRRLVHLSDIARAAARGRWAESEGVAGPRGGPPMGAVLAAPLVLDGGVVGAIVLRRRRRQRFSGTEIALLQGFADHAAVAYQSARRGDDLAAALARQSAEAEILDIISRFPGDLQPVLDKLAESAARVCGAADTLVLLAAGEELVVLAHHGPIEAVLGTRVAIGRGSVSGCALLERTTVQVVDPIEDERFPDTRDLARRFNHRTTVAAPLLREGGALGTIVLRRIEVRPFTEQEIAALRSFAAQAVIAIENARLFAELEARNRDLTVALEQQTATAEILRVISSSPTDTEPVFQTILERSIRLCGAMGGAVLRLEDAQVHLGAFSLSQVSAEAGHWYRGRFPRPLGHVTPADRAMTDRTVVHIPDTELDPGERERGVSQAFEFRSLLVVPMLKGASAVGAIAVYRSTPGPFASAEVHLLRTFADQAVIAVENVRLFTELEARNHALTVALDQQTATAEILRVISRSQTDAQPVFEAIAEAGLRLCQGADVAVFTFDGELLHLVSSVNMVSPEASEALRAAFPRRPEAGSLSGRAVLAREVVEIPDVFEEPDYPLTELARATRSRSLTGIPLLRDGEAIGSLVIGRQEPGRLSADQVALLQTFADQAVIAIENVRLFTELEARNRDLTVALDQQTATAGILRAISQAQTDVEPVFEAIADSLMRLLGTWSALVFRYDGKRLYLVAARGGTPGSSEAILEWFRRRGPEPPEEGRLAGLVVLTRAAQQVEDTETETRFPQLREGARERGFRSTVQVPMLLGGEVVGIVAVTRREPGVYAPAEIALLQTFADQAVIAIENVRLFTALESRNRDLTESLDRQTATAELLRVVSQSRIDVQPVFDAIAASARRLCRAAFAAVFTYDGTMVHLAALDNFNPEGAEEIRRAFPAPAGNMGVATRTIASGVPVIIPDVERDPEYQFVGVAATAGFRSMLSVPMVREGRPIGAIAVARAEPGTFDDSQVELLKTFADQALIAIENARLLSELEGRNRDLTESLERQTATAEILRVISSSPTDTQPVFAALLRSAVDLSGSMFGVAYRYDGERLHVMAHHNMSAVALDLLARTFPAPPGSGTLSAEAVARREPVQFADATEEATDLPGTVAIARALGYRANISVPMLREGQPIGTITMARREPERYTDKQVALLQTFADQAVIAIENVRLFTELGERNHALHESLERQTATAEILRVISEAEGNAQPVFDAIAASALRLLRGFSVVVVRVEGGRAEVVASYGGAEGGETAVRDLIARMPKERGTYLWDAVLDREVQHIADVEAEPAHPLLRASARARGWRANLAVPMMQEGEAVGVIAVSRETPGPFSPQDIDLLKTFADQAAIAVKNAGLLTDLQARTAELTRSVGQLTALGEVGQAVSSSLDLETVLTTIVTRAVQLTGVDDGVVFEYDEAAEEFSHRAGTRTGRSLDQARRDARIRKGEGVLGRTAITHEPVQVPDIARAGVYESRLRETLLASGVRALLAVPMLREGRLLGGLVLSRLQPGEFPPETVDLLRTFATQSALAIQNARLFQELADQGRQLEVASRHKSEFLASMSHELRTPLNAILGFNEMILEDIYGEVPEDLREPLTEMQQSGRHLLRLINNVLDLSKIEAGRMELSLADYAVAEVVERVRASLHSLAAEKGLEFVATVPDDLPIVHGDAGRVTQCLTNLAGNALKFTREGRVEIGAVLDGDRVVFRVTDTGIGIAPDKIETLFTEFRQGDAAIASEFGGTGLGLSITRKFVEMHGGRIWVESELGKGSTFFLALPLRADGGATG